MAISIVFCFPPGVYAMIDLYGQCVQISVYDEDYQGSQVTQITIEQQTEATEAVSSAEGTST